MSLWDVWWVWLLAALLLGILELLTPGYVALGFAIGAGAVSVALLAGLHESVLPAAGAWGPALLLAVFGVLSYGAWFAMRAIFGSPKGSVKTFDYDIND